MPVGRRDGMGEWRGRRGEREVERGVGGMTEGRMKVKGKASVYLMEKNVAWH